eukprot:TRINITY_DN11280_c0_g1_i4.p1 TRINITY_DN11280_c0_g1~~TRINITY_DN11280_c0_g1_i4.p1  ORF type:complete len:733 (-),score=130.69 TRINITY_DN11280_c0_g1_i4:104-2242(-)
MSHHGHRPPPEMPIPVKMFMLPMVIITVCIVFVWLPINLFIAFRLIRERLRSSHKGSPLNESRTCFLPLIARVYREHFAYWFTIAGVSFMIVFAVAFDKIPWHVGFVFISLLTVMGLALKLRNVHLRERGLATCCFVPFHAPAATVSKGEPTTTSICVAVDQPHIGSSTSIDVKASSLPTHCEMSTLGYSTGFDDIKKPAPASSTYKGSSPPCGFFGSLRSGIRRRLKIFVPFAIIFVTLAFLLTMAAPGICIEVNPVAVSTAYSRSLQPSLCQPMSVCHSYFTVPDDLSTSMIFTFQTRDLPIVPAAPEHRVRNLAGFCLFSNSSHPIPTNATITKDLSQIEAAYGTLVVARTIKADEITEETRFVSWCDVTNLQPNSTYHFRAGYFVRSGAFILGPERKVRTAPSDRNGSYSFVTGGDMSMDESNTKLLVQSARSEPLFAAVGGDIAYDNAFSTCYRRWDRWFARWNEYMTTPQGFSVPMVLSVGNHEASGFFAQPKDSLYYNTYFPQQLGLPASPTANEDRLAYHAHRIGNSTLFMSLDSWVMTPMAGAQTDFIRDQLVLAEQQNVPVRFAMYHASLFPAKEDEFPIISEDGLKHWEPLFSQYKLAAAFENHYHLYKRTKLIQQGKVSESGHGTLYIGDGSWGIVSRNSAIDLTKWWMETAQDVAFVVSVTVNAPTSKYGSLIAETPSDIMFEAIGVDGEVFDSWRQST